eukprot:2381174-Rhodomonas_salina.2
MRGAERRVRVLVTGEHRGQTVAQDDPRGREVSEQGRGLRVCVWLPSWRVDVWMCGCVHAYLSLCTAACSLTRRPLSVSVSVSLSVPLSLSLSLSQVGLHDASGRVHRARGRAEGPSSLSILSTFAPEYDDTRMLCTALSSAEYDNTHMFCAD